jgi:hypothetical protein
MDQRPEPPPEARLLEDARRAIVPKLSQRAAAKLAGLSDARWRQIVAGYQQIGKGVTAPVTSPPDTLARMARAVGITAEQLDFAGRADAAEVMSRPTVGLGRGLGLLIPMPGSGNPMVERIRGDPGLSDEAKSFLIDQEIRHWDQRQKWLDKLIDLLRQAESLGVSADAIEAIRRAENERGSGE